MYSGFKRFINRLAHHGVSIHMPMVKALIKEAARENNKSGLSGVNIKVAMPLMDLPMKWTPEEYAVKNKLSPEVVKDYLGDISKIYSAIRSSGALFLPKIPIVGLIQAGSLLTCDESGNPTNISDFASGPGNIPKLAGINVFAAKRLPHGIHEDWKYDRVYKILEMEGNEADVACKFHKYAFLKEAKQLSEPMFPPKPKEKKKK